MAQADFNQYGARRGNHQVILPLQLKEGESVASLGLTGEEEFSIQGVAQGLASGFKDGRVMKVQAKAADGFASTARTHAHSRQMDSPGSSSLQRQVPSQTQRQRISAPRPPALHDTLVVISHDPTMVQAPLGRSSRAMG